MKGNFSLNIIKYKCQPTIYFMKWKTRTVYVTQKLKKRYLMKNKNQTSSYFSYTLTCIQASIFSHLISHPVINLLLLNLSSDREVIIS
jgi:hypothetical protein